MNRGDVVIVDFSRLDPADKVRPALIVQRNHENQVTNRTVVAHITGNISRSHLDTQLLIDRTHADFDSSGLHGPSSINCTMIFNIRQLWVQRKIGSLSAQTMQKIDECLKAALGVV